MALRLVLFISWWSNCAGFNLPTGGFTGGFTFRSEVLPSEELVAGALDITSTITNLTARNMLADYLTVCPGQDMCKGESFKTNYTFGVSLSPACSTCSCDDSCARKKNCCPSNILDQNSLGKKSTPLACLKPLWNPTFAVLFQAHRASYWMIETCPSGESCVPPLSKADVRNNTLSLPVTSLRTNETYRNIRCALCHSENLTDLVFWNHDQIICTSRSELLSKITSREFVRLVFNPYPSCNFLFYPPVSLQKIVSKCTEVDDNYCINANILPADKAYLVDACAAYNLPYFSCRTGIVHRNVYCYLCTVPRIYDAPIACPNNSHLFQLGADKLPIFSALLNLEKEIAGETRTVTQDEMCTDGELYDTFLDKCLKLTCEDEYILEGNTVCQSMYSTMGENNYEVNMMFYPTESVGLEVDVKKSLRDFLQGVFAQNNISRYLCTITVLSPIDEQGGGPSRKTDVIYHGVVVKLSVNHPNNIDSFIENLIRIVTFENEIELSDRLFNHRINVTGFIIGQRFHLYEDNFYAYKDPHYIHPITFKRLHSKLFDIANQANDIRRYNCVKEKAHIVVVADWYRCPKVNIETADARLELSNFTLCLTDNQNCIPSRYFKQSLNNQKFQVCLDWYRFSLTTQALSNTIDDSVEKYLSLACLSLSSCGAVMTILSFVSKKSRITSSGTKIIILSVLMILANTVYTFSKYFLWSKELCVTVGMLVHFLWLSVLFWMSLSTFQIFQTFTTLRVARFGKNARVLFLLLPNTFLSILPVGINVILSYSSSQGENLGYSLTTCYIAESSMVLYTFALPVGIAVCLNMFMFLVTVSRIQEKDEVRKSTDHKNIGAFFRLSTLTGVSWLFGFLALLTELHLFSVLHTLFTAGQGVFLYLAFGLTFRCCANEREKTSSGNKSSRSFVASHKEIKRDVTIAFPCLSVF